MLKVQIQKLTPTATLPQRMTAAAAGYDLFSDNQTPLVIEPGKVALVPTGLAIALPVGWEAQVRPRSGLVLKSQIGVLNSPGTIDADYRGEIGIILYNFGNTPYTVLSGTRIAQMVITQHAVIDFELTENLPSTDRGDGGFGHTQV